MKYLQTISERSGLTQTELKVTAFLLFILMIGIVVEAIGWQNNESENTNFQYSTADSIFYSFDQANINSTGRKKTDENINKLEINAGYSTKQELKNKSININSASLEQLIMIPGIGVKTAENILAYRKSLGGFHRIDELLEVKGIGDSKFEKIKKYIYVRREN